MIPSKTSAPSPVGIRRCGETGMLVECDGLETVIALDAALVADPAPGTVDVVPAARTVLIRFDPSVGTHDAVERHVRCLRPRFHDTDRDSTMTLPVIYDGADLDAVAEHVGMDRAGVVEAHTAGEWRVAFGGFAPGFAYLVGGDARLEVPRRPEARTRVPPGAVGLAGVFSGVYPRASPGGWQLIGRTEMRMWDIDREPPALLVPGTRVRFEER